MKKVSVCFDDDDARILENQAYAQKRPFKCHIEFIVLEYLRNKNSNIIENSHIIPNIPKKSNVENMEWDKETNSPKGWKPKYNDNGIICASNNPENDPDYIIKESDTNGLKENKKLGVYISPNWA